LQKRKLQKTNASLVAALSWLIISTILLILPGAAFPKEDWLDRIWFDKWVHVVMFFIMVTLWCMAFRKYNAANSYLKKTFVIVMLLCFVYGIIMEFIQGSFIEYRSFDAGDIAADAVGCVAGWWYSLGRYIKK
jgi:VanZ family protein